LLGSTLTACDLYVEEDPILVDTPDDPWETGTPDAGGGWNCDTNASCAAGCFCNDTGWCEEAGFCETSADCFEGFVCDDRSTCVPEGSLEPEPSCSDLDADETACIAAQACNPVYRGVNCTSDTGAECTAGAASCSCESFALDRCDTIETTDDQG
jgi:hypothetical protein